MTCDFDCAFYAQDPPRGEEYWIPTDPRFTHALDLVTYIKSNPEFSSSFCVGVAAYPDGHADREVDAETELEHLKAKVRRWGGLHHHAALL